VGSGKVHVYPCRWGGGSITAGWAVMGLCDRRWTGGTAGTEDTGNDRKDERKDRRVGHREALHAAVEKEAKQRKEDVHRGGV